MRWPGLESLRPLVGAGRALIIRSGSLLAAFTFATAVATDRETRSWLHIRLRSSSGSSWRLVVDALAIAAQALVGLHLRDPGMARLLAANLLRWGLSPALVWKRCMAAGWGVLPEVFTNDADVLAEVESVYLFIVVMQPLNAIVFVWDGIAIGASSFAYLAASTVASFFATAGVLAVVQQRGWGLPGVWWSLVAMMLVRFGTLAWWHVHGPLATNLDAKPGVNLDWEAWLGPAPKRPGTLKDIFPGDGTGIIPEELPQICLSTG